MDERLISSNKLANHMQRHDVNAFWKDIRKHTKSKSALSNCSDCSVDVKCMFFRSIILHMQTCTAVLYGSTLHLVVSRNFREYTEFLYRIYNYIVGIYRISESLSIFRFY